MVVATVCLVMTASQSNTDREAYAEETLLLDVLGDHPKTRILSALLADHDHDLNPTDIARLAGLERSTVYNHIDDLLAYRLVEQTRTVGNSTMYQLNEDSDAAKRLAAFEWALVELVADLEEAGDVDEDGTPVPPEAT